LEKARVFLEDLTDPIYDCFQTECDVRDVYRMEAFDRDLYVTLEDAQYTYMTKVRRESREEEENFVNFFVD
jgi:hypothetical protein